MNTIENSSYIDGEKIYEARELNAQGQFHSILLVEDSKTDAFLIKKHLGSKFVFKTVSRLTDAVHSLDLASFNLILLDLNLVDSYGTEAVAALHSTAPEIPIIVHSGSRDKKARTEALMCGAMYFVLKGTENLQSLQQLVKRTVMPA